MGHIAEALKKAKQDRAEKVRVGDVPSGVGITDSGIEGLRGFVSTINRSTKASGVEEVAATGGIPAIGATRSGQTGHRLADLLKPEFRRLRGAEEPVEAMGGPTAAEVDWEVDSSLIAVNDRGSSISEQYRAVRTWLLCRVNPRERTCLGITSSVPSEGKTVTVANLSVAMAEIRRMRVLAMDCDLRQGALASMFKLSRAPGLAEVLTGRAKLEEAIVQTPISNLCVLPSGHLKDANPTELLNSSAAARVFDEVRDRFHYTLVDTPPVQRVSDVGVIGALCSGLLMVVRMHKTASHLVRQSITWLQSNNLNVMGCVATGCSLKDATYSNRPSDYPEA